MHAARNGVCLLRVYEGSDVRNVALVGHLNSGKTSLTAAMAFATGATNRLTKVDEGNALTDYDEEEINRKITISSAVAALEWKKYKINIIDTPGFNIFTNDVKQALKAADSVIAVVDGVAGIEVHTEKTWALAEEYGLPRAIVINKLDRERADFERALESVQKVFGRGAVAIQLPIGSERGFRGFIDLITMKAYEYTPGGDGKAHEIQIPGALAADEIGRAHV